MEISRRSAGGVTVLDLTGRLTAGSDGAEVAALRTVICDLINARRLRVIMNLAGLTHVDARGLGEIAMAAEAVQSAAHGRVAEGGDDAGGHPARYAVRVVRYGS